MGNLLPFFHSPLIRISLSVWSSDLWPVVLCPTPLEQRPGGEMSPHRSPPPLPHTSTCRDQHDSVQILWPRDKVPPIKPRDNYRLRIHKLLWVILISIDVSNFKFFVMNYDCRLWFQTLNREHTCVCGRYVFVNLICEKRPNESRSFLFLDTLNWQ